jgi:rod shape-determining protein MreD
VLTQLGESSLIRCGAVLAILLAIQTTVLTQVRPFGVVVDVLAVFAMAAGLIAGPRRGLRVAFVAGVLFDLLVGTTFGIKALAYALVAFAVSFVPFERVLALRSLTAVALGVAAGAAATLEVLLAAFSGREHTLSLRLPLIFLVIAGADMLLAPLAARVMRWCLMVGDRPRL